jgi:hypothetical protein
MNKLLLFFALFFVPFVTFAENPPMQGWSFATSVTLNGRYFMGGYPPVYAESYREQDGYAIVQGIKRHYWLYDTYTYHNGNEREIIDRVIPAWVEAMGYVIDFDNIRTFNPNTELASSVKSLMRQRGCDISVTLVTDLPGYDYVIINDYDRDRDVYSSTLYPLYK